MLLPLAHTGVCYYRLAIYNFFYSVNWAFTSLPAGHRRAVVLALSREMGNIQGVNCLKAHHHHQSQPVLLLTAPLVSRVAGVASGHKSYPTFFFYLFHKIFLLLLLPKVRIRG